MQAWSDGDQICLLINADKALSNWRDPSSDSENRQALSTLNAHFGTLPNSAGRVASMRLSLHTSARERMVEHEPFAGADGIHTWVERSHLIVWRRSAEDLLDSELVPGDALVNLALWQILTLAHEAAGDTIEKLTKTLGPDHLQVMMVRRQLAWSAVSTSDGHDFAISLGEALLDDHLLTLGPDHPTSVGARRDLGYFYWTASRTADEIHQREIVVQESERVLGPDHADTILARSELSWSYWSVSRTAEAIALRMSVLNDFEAILGRDHPETVSARADLEYFRQS